MFKIKHDALILQLDLQKAKRKIIKYEKTKNIFCTFKIYNTFPAFCFCNIFSASLFQFKKSGDISKTIKDNYYGKTQNNDAAKQPGNKFLY